MTDKPPDRGPAPPPDVITSRDAEPGEPLQKWLQRRGLGSRAAVRELIREGRVTVGDEVVRRFAEPLPPSGTAVSVDGVPVEESGPRVVLLMHKPKKHLTQLDDTADTPGLGRYLPADGGRVFPVGRLDFNTEGALLFTNDGALARQILHPEFGLEKRYGVKIRGHLDDSDPGLERMRAGLRVGSESYRPVTARVIALRTRATWVELVLTEGRHRQIRRMCAACGFQIVKLRRLAIGPIELGDLRPRCVRPLDAREIEALEAACRVCFANVTAPVR